MAKCIKCCLALYLCIRYSHSGRAILLAAEAGKCWLALYLCRRYSHSGRAILLAAEAGIKFLALPTYKTAGDLTTACSGGMGPSSGTSTGGRVLTSSTGSGSVVDTATVASTVSCDTSTASSVIAGSSTGSSNPTNAESFRGSTSNSFMNPLRSNFFPKLRKHFCAQFLMWIQLNPRSPLDLNLTTKIFAMAHKVTVQNGAIAESFASAGIFPPNPKILDRFNTRVIRTSPGVTLPNIISKHPGIIYSPERLIHKPTSSSHQSVDTAQQLSRMPGQQQGIDTRFYDPVLALANVTASSEGHTELDRITTRPNIPGSNNSGLRRVYYPEVLYKNKARKKSVNVKQASATTGDFIFNIKKSNNVTLIKFADSLMNKMSTSDHRGSNNLLLTNPSLQSTQFPLRDTCAGIDRTKTSSFVNDFTGNSTAPARDWNISNVCTGVSTSSNESYPISPLNKANLPETTVVNLSLMSKATGKAYCREEMQQSLMKHHASLSSSAASGSKEFKVDDTESLSSRLIPLTYSFVPANGKVKGDFRTQMSTKTKAAAVPQSHFYGSTVKSERKEIIRPNKTAAAALPSSSSSTKSNRTQKCTPATSRWPVPTDSRSDGPVEDVEPYCPVCGENTSESWIQCMLCKTWIHELCANIADPIYFFCDFCHLNKKNEIVQIKFNLHETDKVEPKGVADGTVKFHDPSLSLKKKFVKNASKPSIRNLYNKRYPCYGKLTAKRAVDGL